MQPYPGPGEKWQVSMDGGERPAWSADGREFFYRNGDEMRVVSVTQGPRFTTGRPRLLFEGNYAPYYDVSPDGQHFLMIRSDEESASRQLHVVLNWFEELERRVPTVK